MTSPKPSPAPLRVAALIDLPLSPMSGGHARGWENLAKAAAITDLPLDFTAYFSGETSTQELSAKARIKRLPPIFSTSRLKFLPYVPDNTDLGGYHKELAKELTDYDVIVTTDGFFCFAQTAEKVSRKKGIPLTTSFHTDTPAYARVFTQLTIERLFGQSWLARLLLNVFHLPERQEAAKINRLKKHLRACTAAFYKRDEDRAIAAGIIGDERVHIVRIGTDRDLFGPHRRDRAGVEADYAIPHDRIIVLFVGRLDEGKNIYTLIGAMENLIAEGRAVHLITAGVGPADKDLRERLGDHVTVAGQVSPEEIARLYASADVFALPSEIEIRNTASVEAIVSGLPILVSEKSGIAALCDNTPAMLVVPSGVEAWTNALRDVTGSTNTRLHMGKVARAYADTSIADWRTVLENDFYPVWKKAAEEKKKDA
ncbi:MAG: glycosyltransferase [Bdellovibrionales bacterium]